MGVGLRKKSEESRLKMADDYLIESSSIIVILSSDEKDTLLPLC